jgi:hypothetical protein
MPACDRPDETADRRQRRSATHPCPKLNVQTPQRQFYDRIYNNIFRVHRGAIFGSHDEEADLQGMAWRGDCRWPKLGGIITLNLKEIILHGGVIYAMLHMNSALKKRAEQN